MLTILTLLCAAHAAPAGYYHPYDLSSESRLFGRAQDEAGTVFQARQEKAEALAAALRHYEEALDLLGDRAPQAERERYQALEASFHREFAVLQDFTNQQLEGFETAFVSAMQRAVGNQPLVECHPSQAPSGPRMTPRFGGGGGEPVTCEGEDANPRLAAAMDADPALKAELDAILTRDWPDLTIDAVPQAPIGSSVTATLPIRPFFQRALPDTLDAITSADDDARLEFQAAIEAGATTEQLARFRDEAAAITARTAAQRAEVAGLLQPTLDKLWAKLAKKGTSLGWCAQPELLGACTVPAASDEVQTSVREHPTLRRALAKAAAWRPE